MLNPRRVSWEQHKDQYTLWYCVHGHQLSVWNNLKKNDRQFIVMILIHESGSQVFIDIKKFDKFKSLNADSVGSLYFIPALIRGYVLPCLLAKPIWIIQLMNTCKLIIETRYVYIMHSVAMAVADMTGMICHGPLARYVQLHVAPGMRLECWECFPYHRGMAIPTCITARVSRTCRDACRDR